MNTILREMLKVALGRIGDIIGRILTNLVQQGDLEKAVELAELHVQNYMGSTASNDEKRRMVTESLRADLARDGIEARDSFMNLAIELAVNGLKAGIAEAATAAAAGAAQ